MSTLDTLASRAVYRARLFERAVHDGGPWSIGWGSVRVPAVRQMDDHQVVFVADFGSAPSSATDTLVLYCRDEPVAFKRVEDEEKLSVAFKIEWALEAALAL